MSRACAPRLDPNQRLARKERERKDSDTMWERMEEKKYEEGSGENIQS